MYFKLNLKRALLAAVFGIVAVLCSAVADNQAFAADKPLDKEFTAFWTGFKAALQKNDKNAIADMTKLPYLLNDKKLNRAQFIAQSDKIFTQGVRKCLAHEKPVPDRDSIFVFCGEEIYIFAKDKGAYKFTEIGVND